MSPMIVEDRSSKLASGKLPGYKTFFMNGKRFSLPTTEATLWIGPSGVNKYTFTDWTSASITHISSSSAADTGFVLIDGIDTDWRLSEQQLVQLSGQTKVALATPLYRINRVVSLANLVGYVYVYEDTAITAGVPGDLSKVRAYVDPAINTSSMAVFSVPDGYEAQLVNYNMHCEAKAVGTLHILFHLYANNVRYESADLPFTEGASSISNLPLVIPFPSGSRSDLTVESIAPLAGYGAFFNASFQLKKL